ncbi:MULTISPECIES: autotransporter assembly complex family protein [Sphingobium]|jgi:translocation and assembly module TamA|uniref:BamA/TamA family outer membrane protein n=1 Tax=Sphingobium fuliginis (strain ATCC 27551) TaxID=336203 RepID=A0A292ZCU7_SPHSA|nr:MULTISPECIES: outer membrane protein assembly factor [Sphingobium]QOT72978.1 BamA/TamA family outer membrane protein [Sphingobium fuliginis]GAY20948.1 outer membrane protein assembly factor YaeT precursor [Sphingobium fuliginis]
MNTGLRTCRRISGLPQAALLVPLLLLAPVAHAQAAAQAGAQPVPDQPDLDPNLAPMPDIGVDWPDMGQPDIVTPMVELPPQSSDVPQQAVAPEAAEEQAEEAVTFADTGADAGEERRYTVAMTGVEEIADAQFTTRFNELSVLHQGEGKPANLAQINRRIKEDSDLLDRLLRAKGYYAARIRGAVTPPAAGGDRLAVTFRIVPGARYLLSSVDLKGLENTGEREPELRSAFPPKAGDPVDADAILAGQQSLAVALLENGFPFGKVEEPEVRIDHEERKGDLDIVVNPGAYRTFGRIVMANDALFSARHVQRIARFRPGDTYMASDVEDLRQALIATGLVSSLTMTPRDAGDGEHVDLAIDARPAPLRTIAGELGYGTGEGYRAEVSWAHRNFFPPEGAVTVRGVIGTQEQTASFTYRRNNFRRRDNVLTGLLSVSNIKRDAYDARTITLSGALERQTNILFQKKWVWRIGGELIASDEADAFSNGSRRTFLIGAIPLSLTYDGSDDLLNPSRGFRLGGRLSPELSFQNSTFGYARVQLDGSVYQPMNDRIVLAARARFGTILGSTVDRIAPSRRFYAGGGASVRGYGYQAIGPRYGPNDDPVGGKSLAEFSLESRIRFGNFGVVPFVDAGNISTSFLPRFRDLRIGAGLGVRYYSSFGPIRIDVGTPLNPQSGDPKIAVYVSLGQAF